MPNRAPRNASLLQQISETNPFKAELAHRFFKIGNDFDRDIEAIGADRRWSADHKRERARERVQEALRALDEATRPITDHIKQSASLRAGIKLPAYDKNDVVGAMRRAELRQLARGMSFGQREMYLTGARLDKDLVDACLEFAPWASGFSDDPNELALYNAARESRLAEINGPLMAALEARAGTESEIMVIVNVIKNDVASAAVDLARAA